MTTIVRLDENTIEVDSIIFVLKVTNNGSWYEAHREEYRRLRIYDSIIVSFLQLEAQEEEEVFNEELMGVLYENGMYLENLN